MLRMKTNEVMPAVTNNESSAPVFDSEKQAELTVLAQGERSILEYSNDSGVNRGLIGELRSGKMTRPPSRTTLMRLTDPVKARPRNNVSLNDMLRACGYKEMEIPVGEERRMTFGDSIVRAFSSSKTRPMAMLLDYIISTEYVNNYQVDVHGGWFKLTRAGSSGVNASVGISAFCDLDYGAQAMMITIEAMLLESVMTDEEAQDLSTRTYFILTDRDDVFQFAMSLPRMGMKELFVLQADERHESFEKIEKVFGDGDDKPLARIAGHYN